MAWKLTPVMVKIRPIWLSRYIAKCFLKPGEKRPYERQAFFQCLNCDSTDIRIRGFIEKKEVECKEGFEGATRMVWSFHDAFCEACGQDMMNEIAHQDLQQRYP